MHSHRPENTKFPKTGKILRLLPVILKNFFPVLLGELRDLFRRSRPARWIAGVLLITVLSLGGCRLWKDYHFDPNSPDLTLAQAGRIGEVTTKKLLIQMGNRPCPDGHSSCFERGDIVLIKSGDWVFSDGEKEGFLILRMDLTDKQAEVLVRSIEKKAAGKPPPADPKKEEPPPSETPTAAARPTLGDLGGNGKKAEPENGAPEMETVKLRKFAVDLEKIGIQADEQKGREITEPVYKWDIVTEKD